MYPARILFLNREHATDFMWHTKLKILTLTLSSSLQKMLADPWTINSWRAEMVLGRDLNAQSDGPWLLKNLVLCI